MTRMILALAVALSVAAMTTGCTGDGLSYDERAAVVASDSGCDNSSSASDPASPCFIARHKPAN